MIAQGAVATVVRSRRRNPRGEGARLAAEIVDGAMALIEREGSADAVTLRAVAREVGIAAPSIYAHFADRDAIITAVIERVFEMIQEALEAAVAAANPAASPGVLVPSADPAIAVDQLVAGCESYVSFGLAHPAWYRTVFAKEHEEMCAPAAALEAIGAVGAPSPYLHDGLPPVGGQAFALLVDAIARCIELGVSASTDPFTDATAIWVALHGTVSLWSSMGNFPWPERAGFVRRIVLSLARVAPDA